MHQDKFDYNNQFQILFGEYVQALKKTNKTNTQASRKTDAIYF